MENPSAINAVVAGQILFETIINRDGRILLQSPGGSALYCAAGFRLWGKVPGILGKVSEDRSESWLRTYAAEGINTEGVIKLRGAFDQDRFFAVLENGSLASDSPQKYFFAQNQPMPKFLLGYEPVQVTNKVNRAIQPSSISPDDIPEDYLRISTLIIAPSDLYTHLMLPPFFRSRTDGRIIFCGSSSYMQPAFWYEFPSLIQGTEVFITTETQLKRLFLGKNENMWEMIAFTASAGAKIVLVYGENGDHYLFDREANLKYRIPRYDADAVDPIGAYPAFCGGFSSPYITHFDPLESALMASVTASIKMEGSSPLYLLQTLPELAQARVNALRGLVSVA